MRRSVRALIPVAVAVLGCVGSDSLLSPERGERAREVMGALKEPSSVKEAIEAEPSRILTTSWLPVFTRFPDPEMVSWLLEHGADPEQEVEGHVPLHSSVSAAGASLDVAEILWLHGASPDPVTPGKLFGGRTPLLDAAGNHEAEMISVLLERGAEPNRMDGTGMLPLHVACRGGQGDAARFGAIAAVRALLDGGADPDLMEESGNSALTAAVGKPEVIALLLERGADARLGWPLARAAREGDLESARLLVQAGASPNSRDQRDDPALILAIRAGAPDLVQLLVQAGAAVDEHRRERDPRNDTTALFTALREGELEVVEILLDAGASPSERVSMQTPLHLAAVSAHRACRDHEGRSCRRALDSIDRLIAAGADPDLVDGGGETPLDRAEGTAAVEEILRSHGARSAQELPDAERSRQIRELERRRRARE